MKNFIYAIACAIMALTFNIQTAHAAFPFTEIVVVDDTVSTHITIASKSTETVTKAPQRAQHDGRGATAAGAGFGIAALACGAVGLFVLGIPLGLAAIVFGVIGFNRKLKGLAYAGFALGIIDIIGALLFIAAMA